MIDGVYSAASGRDAERAVGQPAAWEEQALSEKDLAKRLRQLEKQMLEHARNLEFEQAARVRDQLAQLKQHVLGAAGEGSAAA